MSVRARQGTFQVVPNSCLRARRPARTAKVDNKRLHSDPEKTVRPHGAVRLADNATEATAKGNPAASLNDGMRWTTVLRTRGAVDLTGDVRMPYSVSVSPENGWVEVRHHGPITSAEMYEARHQSVQALQQASLTRVLVDVRDADTSRLSLA